MLRTFWKMRTGSFIQSTQSDSHSFTNHQPSCEASLIAKLITNPPAVQETPVRFLGRQDPLENEMATHSSVLAWRIPLTQEPGYSPWGHKRQA